mgnify:CR=1 FL=1
MGKKCCCRNRFYDWPEFEIQTVRGLGYRAVKKV